MDEDPGGVAATQRGGRSTQGWRRYLPVLIGIAVAAVIGGVAGGLIVWATTSSDNDNSSNATASDGTGTSCDAANVADRALPSVVTVRAASNQGAGSGSGVVIRSGGYVLTNNHVIAVGAGNGAVSILRGDGQNVDATIVGRDPLTDLAVIKAKDASGLSPITVGKSTSVQVGQPVVAIGSPLGLTSTVTTGIVSALDRYVRVPAENGATAHLVGAIQTDASINPGNSGGALVDCAARLVGINTAGAAVPNSPGGSIGLGFAIPVDFAKRIAEELIAEGKVTRPNLGLQVQAIPEELARRTGGSAGLFVQSVTSGGAAANAGLRPGDVIVEVDGEPAHDADALIVKTLTMKAGDTLRVKYERQGSSHTTVVTLTP